jgi:hypothetical protein
LAWLVASWSAGLPSLCFSLINKEPMFLF